ncbi:MAG TPA: chemotaxis protein CheW [Gemmatimonadales bacterium]|jgi:purine-binding chemotaxis protein CheW|nr:chemotaxis protein CheW [Gemmatimonadales bacterium]
MTGADVTTSDDVQVVTFKVGRQEFAFDILQVERILRYTEPSPLPKAPDFLEGVLPYGSSAVPVIDLRKRFEVEAPITDDSRLMVLELENQRVAVLVDSVCEVVKVDSTAIAAPGPVVAGLAAVYIAGIISLPERTIIILNSRKLLSSTERLALQSLGAA